MKLKYLCLFSKSRKAAGLNIVAWPGRVFLMPLVATPPAPIALLGVLFSSISRNITFLCP